MSLRASVSTSSARRTPPPPLPSVITSPPWAKDEPPSPTDEPFSFTDTQHATQSRPSVASFQSNDVSNSASRWWAFTRPRGGSDATSQFLAPEPKPDRKTVSFKDRSMSWLGPSPRDGGATFPRRSRQPTRVTSINRNWNLSITMPTPPAPSLTLNNAMTPGWDVPWTSRVGAQGPAHRHNTDGELFAEEEEEESSSPVDPDKHYTVWRRRRKRLRVFILSNTYVPLLFRCINIALTTTALGIAIRIRLLERRMHTMGELGSSPTLVIIFAPLTLVHVLTSVYLEYFGRPLGLWRTSAKLAHTLLEVLFICAWSAALSLCFDNFFTSIIPCSSAGSISWYSTIPRPKSDNDPVSDDKRCDDQLALISLVFLSLLAYCVNLVISLFRIFEKVKYRPGRAVV
ncbi:hypothetical protein FB45DRAFT_917488 [Roridomyces roridus]|uniref:Regulator of phospholipase D SRF1 n=1 Tax=Roridomyces roridus TaxID=1738132 RepID=A0AAD7BV02_9AGAR|nr:hypothetical protein FB45DRAFT_917488 [Roridomyces roridus]